MSCGQVSLTNLDDPFCVPCRCSEFAQTIVDCNPVQALVCSSPCNVGTYCCSCNGNSTVVLRGEQEMRLTVRLMCSFLTTLVILLLVLITLHRLRKRRINLIMLRRLHSCSDALGESAAATGAYANFRSSAFAGGGLEPNCRLLYSTDEEINNFFKNRCPPPPYAPSATLTDHHRPEHEHEQSSYNPAQSHSVFNTATDVDDYFGVNHSITDLRDPLDSLFYVELHHEMRRNTRQPEGRRFADEEDLTPPPPPPYEEVAPLDSNTPSTTTVSAMVREVTRTQETGAVVCGENNRYPDVESQEN